MSRPAAQPRVGPEHVLFPAFDALFVINLPSRDDRRREFDQQLKTIGLSLEHPRVALFPAVRPTEKAGFPDVGSRGCFMSHLGILRAAAEADLNAIIVCEDDLDLARDFEAKIARVVPALASMPWDIVHGGYGAAPSGAPIEGCPEVRLVPADEGILCTHFLFFRGKVISELRDYLLRILDRPPGDPAGGPMHVDGAISRFRADHPEFTTLAVVPPLGDQRPSRTDIHELAWFDRAPLIRDVVPSIRRLKRGLTR